MGLKLAEAFIKLGFDKSTFDREFGKVKKGFKAGLNDMQAAAQQARLGVLLGAGAIGVVTKVAASFEQSMARVKAISGATGSEFDTLSAKARELGKSTVFTADNAAEAMGNFALAGFTTKEMLDAIGPTLNLAAAGQLDMGTSASIVSKAMRGMQIDTSKTAEVVDILTKAFTTSNTDLIQLGEAFKFVGPIGAAAGKGIEELTAAIQIMSDAGVQGGLAGTSLRNILIRLQSQPSEVAKAMKRMGVEVATADGKMRHLADIIDDMNEAMSSMTQIQKSATVAQVGGLRAIAGLTVLLDQGGDKLRMFEARLAGAGGTAEKIANIQMDTLTGEILKLKSAVGELMIVFGNQFIPQIRKMAEGFTRLIGSLSGTSGETVSAIANFALLAVKFGALVVVAGTAVTALKALGVVVASLANVYALVAVGVGLLALAWVDSIAKGQTYVESLADMTQALLGVAQAEDKANEAKKRRLIGTTGGGVESRAAEIAIGENEALQQSGELAADKRRGNVETTKQIDKGIKELEAARQKIVDKSAELSAEAIRQFNIADRAGEGEGGLAFGILGLTAQAAGFAKKERAEALDVDAERIAERIEKLRAARSKTAPPDTRSADFIRSDEFQRLSEEEKLPIVARFRRKKFLEQGGTTEGNIKQKSTKELLEREKALEGQILAGLTGRKRPGPNLFAESFQALGDEFQSVVDELTRRSESPAGGLEELSRFTQQLLKGNKESDKRFAALLAVTSKDIVERFTRRAPERFTQKDLPQESESPLERAMIEAAIKEEANTLAQENLTGQIETLVAKEDEARNRLSDIDNQIEQQKQDRKDSQRFQFTSLEGFSRNIQQGLGVRDKLAKERNKILKNIEGINKGILEREGKLADVIV